MAKQIPVINNNPIPGILPPMGASLSQPTRPNQQQVTNPPNGPNRTPENFIGITTATLAIDTPVDDCMRSVSVEVDLTDIYPFAPFDVPTSATVSVSVNGVIMGAATFTTGFIVETKAPFGAEEVKPTVEVPLACSLNVGDVVQATIDLLPAAVVVFAPSMPVTVVSHIPYSVLTQHYDNARTGWYRYAGLTWISPVPVPPGTPPRTAPTPINVGNVSGLVQKFTMSVDDGSGVDTPIYAQPLYMHHQYFPGQGAHNVVYVATEKDTVFAFDADIPGPPLWQRSLLKPGESVVSTNDIQGCSNISPTIGITGTPVIDCGCNSTCGCGSCGCGECSKCSCPTRCSTPTMYVVSKSLRRMKNSDGTDAAPTFHLYLHALDTTTGLDRPCSPVELFAQVDGAGGDGSIGGTDGHGHVLFVPYDALQRPALLLQNGIVYVAIGSHCDLSLGDYHGWVLAYDAATLKQISVFCDTPDGSGAGIWMSGFGPAGDGHSIYFNTGNGGLRYANDIQGGFNANVGGRNYGNCVLKLSSDLCVQSWFCPADQWFLQNEDIDLGSAGLLLIPGPQFGSPPNLLVTCGKDGNVMLLNRDGLGRYSGPTPNDYPGANPNAVFTVLLQGSLPPVGVAPPNQGDGEWQTNDYQPGVWGGPAFYKGPFGPENKIGQFIYFCGDTGPLTSFILVDGTLAGGSFSFDMFDGDGGSTPIVTSDQQVPGTGIVWAIDRTDGNKNIHLRAYDATVLGNDLLSTPGLLIGTWTSGGVFIEPMIINGTVYIGSRNEVVVFSL